MVKIWSDWNVARLVLPVSACTIQPAGKRGALAKGLFSSSFNDIHVIKLEKWFPLRGERAHSLKLFCMYIRGLRYQKQNRMEEETEPQT